MSKLLVVLTILAVSVNGKKTNGLKKYTKPHTYTSLMKPTKNVYKPFVLSNKKVVSPKKKVVSPKKKVVSPKKKVGSPKKVVKSKFPTRYPSKKKTKFPTLYPTNYPTLFPTFRSNISNCLEWSCMEWCEFYIKEFEEEYIKHGCVDDGNICVCN